MRIKTMCTKLKCTYRKQVDKNKAFCMLPTCPFKKSIEISKPDSLKSNSTLDEIIKRNRNKGLIP